MLRPPGGYAREHLKSLRGLKVRRSVFASDGDSDGSGVFGFAAMRMVQLRTGLAAVITCRIDGKGTEYASGVCHFQIN